MDIAIMNKKYGFVYIWFDRKHKRYYVGCHWGFVDDGYICSSPWMKKTYKNRPQDFKRRILKNNIHSKNEMYDEEMRWLKMIKISEIKPSNEFPRYYNLNIKNNETWHKYDDSIKNVGQKISISKKGKKTGACSPEKAAAISIAKKQKNRKFTEEHKEKLRQAKIGMKYSDERKQEISDRVKNEWATGKRIPRGIPLSDEHKSKISTSQKGKKISPEQIETMRKSNSKKYIILFQNGNQKTIFNLKQYSKDNNIPYVSLYKASQNKTKLPKYFIESISLSV
jgi:hypothetical protein